MLRRKTIQVDSPRQTVSKDFYNTVLFLQQRTLSFRCKALSFRELCLPNMAAQGASQPPVFGAGATTGGGVAGAF
jgi:hypothetical protein